MHERLRKAVIGSMLAVSAGWAALGCGRSENVGWSQRDIPDSLAAVAAEQGAAARAAAAQGSSSQEYQQLAESLSRLQMEALADPEISAQWTRLLADVDEAIVTKSEFHRQLLERRNQIDSLVTQSMLPGGERLTREQETELIYNLENIESEMRRVRKVEFQGLQFRRRYLRLQADLYERMRVLAPERKTELDRLEELELQMFLAMDTVQQVPILPPAVPPGR